MRIWFNSQHDLCYIPTSFLIQSNNGDTDEGFAMTLDRRRERERALRLFTSFQTSTTAVPTAYGEAAPHRPAPCSLILSDSLTHSIVPCPRLSALRL
jgi:hypothetical protein